ncbi:MAG: XdhC family protein [Alphaproteobacteria bacterium]|nr:XdhC family protein [Alphaproteobacteria bacterium]
MKRDILDLIQDVKARRQSAVLITEMSSGEQSLLREDGETRSAYGAPLPAVEDLDARLDAVMARDKGEIVDSEAGRYFIQPFNPPKRMLITGAVHISQALAPMALATGYDVRVIDPRSAWATPERFPGILLDQRWPDEVMEEIPPDRGTAVVTLTHDPKIDDPALEAALQSDAFYIGALGSKKTHGKRVARLTEAGFSEAQIARIQAPIGLDIGAISPAEIAVAVLAQTTLALRGPRRSKAA